MKKAIILLSGTPEGKAKFIEVAKTLSWVKNVSFKTQLGVYTQSLHDGVERNEAYDNFIYELRDLVNRYFDAEIKFIERSIERFIFDKQDEKHLPDGKSFTTSLLILHGVSKNLFETLKAEHGVFVLKISRRSFNSTESETDTVLYDDSSNFDETVARIVRTLTESTE